MKRLLALSVVALALSACGPKGGTPPNAPGDAVTPYAFEGTPGRFQGRYTGSCIVTKETVSTDKCSVEIEVQQSARRLVVKTEWTTWEEGRGGRRNSRPQRCNERTFESTDRFRIEGADGKSLVSERNEAGSLGADGFGFGDLQTGEGFVFTRRADRQFDFTTSSFDSNHRRLSVNGTVEKRSGRN